MTAQTVLTPQQIRHRVVGAIVFLSLCILVLPWFLDSDQAAYDPRQIAIEDVPVSPFAGPPTAPAQMPEQAATLINQAGQILDPNAEAVVAMPDAWAVRAGTFRSEKNARNLVAKLEAKDWAQVRVLQRGDLYRVLIGPLRDRGEADQLLVALRKDFELDGAVTRFQP